MTLAVDKDDAIFFLRYLDEFESDMELLDYERYTDFD